MNVVLCSYAFVYQFRLVKWLTGQMMACHDLLLMESNMIMVSAAYSYSTLFIGLLYHLFTSNHHLTFFFFFGYSVWCWYWRWWACSQVALQSVRYFSFLFWVVEGEFFRSIWNLDLPLSLYVGMTWWTCSTWPHLTLSFLK